MLYIDDQLNNAKDAASELAEASLELSILLTEANRNEAHRMKCTSLNARLALWILGHDAETVATGDEFIRIRNQILHEMQGASIPHKPWVDMSVDTKEV